MTRKSKGGAVRKSPEHQGAGADAYLLLAERARNETARRRWAKAGLKLSGHKETTLLLWEQLYRAELREHRFEDALAAARAMVELGVLVDGAHARAAAIHQALGETEAAERELRQAASVAPGQRRAFHLWSLGAFLHQEGRLQEALAVFHRAERIDPRPLTRAHAAVVRAALGERTEGLAALASELEADPGREGYGRFVLALLYEELGQGARARQELDAFVQRNQDDPERSVTLHPEIETARRHLRRLGPAAPGRVIPLRARRAR